jgi:drug/metabolite transporter (DMT)-like permease
MTSLGKQTTRKGILFFVVAMNLLPFLDGTAKQLLHDGYNVLQILWARYFFSTLLTLPLAFWFHGRKVFRPVRPGLQFGRGLLQTFSTLMLFIAFGTMPLADALAVFYAYPLVVTAISPFLLGEHIGWRRWSAVFVGFAGTLLIVRPGFEALNIGAVIALCGSFGFAFYLVLTRKIAGAMAPELALTYQCIISAVILSAIVPYFWTTPDLNVWMMFIAIGALSAIGHLLVINAFNHAPASLLAPLGYTEIITAAGIGFIMFGDLPDSLTWVGIFVISASGIYISWRERIVK